MHLWHQEHGSAWGRMHFYPSSWNACRQACTRWLVRRLFHCLTEQIQKLKIKKKKKKKTISSLLECCSCSLVWSVFRSFYVICLLWKSGDGTCLACKNTYLQNWREWIETASFGKCMGIWSLLPECPAWDPTWFCSAELHCWHSTLWSSPGGFTQRFAVLEAAHVCPAVVLLPAGGHGGHAGCREECMEATEVMVCSWSSQCTWWLLFHGLLATCVSGSWNTLFPSFTLPLLF